MVQYIITPWRSRAELLQVRRVLFPDRGDSPGTIDGAVPGNKDGRYAAVARIAMWVQRGACPHVVESTGLLVAVALTDEDGVNDGTSARDAVGKMACRAAYASAFSRFVTGLVDGQQQRTYKVSMYELARDLGLPAGFVELRHRATHEPLPSLGSLRTATASALDWMWEHYWALIPDSTEPTEDDNAHDPVARAVRAVLDHEALHDRTNPDAATTAVQLASQLRAKWGEGAVLAALSHPSLAKASADTSHSELLRRHVAAARLTRLVLMVDANSQAEEQLERSTDVADVRADMARTRTLLEQEAAAVQEAEADLADKVEERRRGWVLCGDDWRPKPIGVA